MYLGSSNLPFSSSVSLLVCPLVVPLALLTPFRCPLSGRFYPWSDEPPFCPVLLKNPFDGAKATGIPQINLAVYCQGELGAGGALRPELIVDVEAGVEEGQAPGRNVDKDKEKTLKSFLWKKP